MQEGVIRMVEVPSWWVVASGIYFVISIIWSVSLVVGLLVAYKKVMPLLANARTQAQRVTGQAKAIAAKASNTADIVHAQTQHLLGNANQASNRVTGQARTVGSALTVLLVASRVVNFVRRMI